MAEICPKCKSSNVHGGMDLLKWLVFLILLPTIIGAILVWMIWRKKKCYDCGMEFT